VVAVPAPTVTPPRIGTGPQDPQRASNALASSVNDALTEVFGQAIVDGVLVKGARLVFDAQGNPADTPIKHGLGRQALGFVVVNRLASFDIWTSLTPNPQPNSHLLVSHNAGQTAFSAKVDLWVF
jgi:hypothetical protein